MMLESLWEHVVIFFSIFLEDLPRVFGDQLE